MAKARDGAQVIVLGNEKGGCGKSTTAMHLIVGLLEQGFQVASIDLDARQRTLSRYIENRRVFAARKGVRLTLPEHRVIAPSEEQDRSEAEADEKERLSEALMALARSNRYIVIDCPGADNSLSRLGHSYAETLITPLNDSFVDVDLLASVDPDSFEVVGPSHYSEMVWEQRKQRMLRQGRSMDWIVMRNRLSSLDAHNKRRVGRVLQKLAGRVGFRVAPGFGERVIYRELFLKGLTLLDLTATEVGTDLTMSHVAARQELRNLMLALGFARPVRQAEAV